MQVARHGQLGNYSSGLINNGIGTGWWTGEEKSGGGGGGNVERNGGKAIPDDFACAGPRFCSIPMINHRRSN